MMNLPLPSDNSTDAGISVVKPLCPKCGQPHRLGELICPQCGALLAHAGQTQQINIVDLPARRKTRHGEAYASDQKAISFDINGQQLSMPIKDSLVIGRQSDIADDVQPDLDLSPFDAHACGVSRRHVEIRHQGFLTYVIDLGSSNGTWLNGQRLIQSKERLLRNGDELQLGHLKIRIRF
jgi:hypothetical protein